MRCLLLLCACGAAASNPDLSVAGADLSDRDLAGSGPSGTDLAGIDLAGADLSTVKIDLGSSASSDLSTPSGDAAVPPSLCTPPIGLADVSTPTTTLSGGSCSQAGLQAALGQGGVITFSCGAAFSLRVTTPLTVSKATVLDGGGQVTLSGGGTSRILTFDTGNFDAMDPKLTVQRLTFRDGLTSDVANTTSTSQGGAAIYRVGGALDVIDCIFLDNTGPSTGQDVAGGAIYSIGGGLTTIVGSSFTGNRCSNGGALGVLGALGLTVVNSRISGSHATGMGANPGNGGNGGAISFDGSSTTGSAGMGPFNPKTLTLCGVAFSDNHAGAGALGGAIFRTVDTVTGLATTGPAGIDQCSFDSNDAPKAGAIYLHQVDLTMTNSTVSRNTATSGAAGGIWLEGGGGGTITTNLTNVTLANNHAIDGLGGAVFFGSSVGGGTWRNVTIASNQVTTTSANPYAVFAAGLMGAAGITLANSIVANNDKPIASGDAYNCQNQYLDGGGNLQWPAEPTHLCAAGATAADPMLGALGDNGGPTQTMAIPANSPAAGIGASCPAADERGHARPSACASGAFEP